MIRVLNQLDYEHVLYPTSLERGTAPHEPYPSVAKAGCGLICACMLVSLLTEGRLDAEEAVRISVNAGANTFGTNMPLFSAKIAELFDLELSSGTACEPLLSGLHGGGAAILHAGKPQGLFSDGGHFVLAAAAKGDSVYVLDPSFTDEKYKKEYRRGLFTLESPFVVVPAETVMEQIRYRTPSWYMFKKVLRAEQH